MSSQGFDGKVPSENLMDKNSLRKILKCDDGYNLLKPTRGTSACWETARTDLLAMLKLGNATWFCSFSAGDMRWTEIVVNILKGEVDSRSADFLDCSEKCGLPRRNPASHKNV